MGNLMSLAGLMGLSPDPAPAPIAERLEEVHTAPATNDAPISAEPRRNAWTITLGGKPICTMVGEPMTHAEALEAARYRWPDAEVKP
ncbi:MULTISPECIES: hypothetical protein [Pseudomonas]|uniref:hypothetical protein n=1 Tax=Pseudomonas TaxID=286 RepID=UPI0007EE54B2|nr:hypothetical protein [Pseudomonas sp. AU12215]OBY59362.1 hypothetical protein A9513_028410 [Pseudomonas sp. AU12215]